MTSKATLPFDQLVRAVELQTLSAEVVTGDDAGAFVSVDTPILSVGTAKGNDLQLSDPTVSRFHVEFEATESGIRATDHRSTNGTRVGDIRLERAVLPRSGATLRLGQTTIQLRPGKATTADLKANTPGFVGQSPAVQHLMLRIEKASQSEVSTLIIGESGTGKEVVARALHESSGRSDAPVVTVDCASISPNLIASELFGHEKGAFTGADRRHIGAFERANGGTVFLDEVGELPAALQPSLLGALERQRFRRVGGAEEVEVDVRVVAATNRDLRAEVNEGRFRLDLYYRLAVVTLTIPPLRERREDIPLLVEHFCRQLKYDPALLGEDFIESVSGYSWPGNVRELKNLVEATIAMGEAPELFQDAPVTHGDLFERVLPRSYKEARGAVLDEFESRFFRYWLDKTGGNVAAAARETKMDRSHLFGLLKKHGLR